MNDSNRSNNHDGNTLKRHPVLPSAHQQLSPTDVSRKRGASKNMKQSHNNNDASSQTQQQHPKRKYSWCTLLFPVIVLFISCSWIFFLLFVLVYHQDITPNQNRGHAEKGRVIIQTQQQQQQEPIRRNSPSGTALRFSSAGWQAPTNNKQNNDIPSTTNNASINKKLLPSLPEAKTIKLTPLTEPIDYEKYTIRMNTWKRNEQLLVSLNHHASCEGVAQIQVIWCNAEEDPPLSVVNHPSGKVVVERHTVNSLNERFHILPNTHTPTLGILSLDDDVLRPCQAWDSGKEPKKRKTFIYFSFKLQNEKIYLFLYSLFLFIYYCYYYYYLGFFKWTQVPDAIVAYDYRLHHKKNNEEWQVTSLFLIGYEFNFFFFYYRVLFIIARMLFILYSTWDYLAPHQRTDTA